MAKELTPTEAVVAKQAELSAAVEELLFKAASGEELSVEETMTVSLIYRERTAFDRAIDAAKGIVQWQERAGSEKGRSDLATKLEAAEAEYAQKRAGLEERIAAAQQELQQLAGAPEVLRQQLKRMQEAVEWLRKWQRFPEHVCDAITSMSRQHRRRFESSVQAEGRVKTIDGRLQSIREMEKAVAGNPSDVGLREKLRILLHSGRPIGGPDYPADVVRRQLQEERDELLADLEHDREAREASAAKLHAAIDRYYV